MMEMKKTVIFGSGQIGFMLGLLAGDQYRVVCYADNDPQKQGKVLHGHPILSPKASLELKPQCCFIGVLDEERARQMEAQLCSLGFTGEIIRPDSLYTFDPRIATMRLLARQLEERHIPGDAAEVGVYRGDFATLINAALPGRKLHLFDTFTGFDDRDILIEQESGLSRARTGDFSQTDQALVLQKMSFPRQIVFHPGYFPDTFPPCAQLIFSFVSLDVDLYAPTAAALKLFWPRLASGGCILVHDYNSTQFSGPEKAVREFCEARRIYPVPVCDLHGSVVLMKQ